MSMSTFCLIASDKILLSAYLIIQDVEKIKARLSLELDPAHDRGTAMTRFYPLRSSNCRRLVVKLFREEESK